MRGPVFLRSPLLDGFGIEHGFGTRGSADSPIRGVLVARQVHGAAVLHVPPLAPGAEADALLTEAEGQAVGVVTADCVPILLADERGRAVAAVHAGWRGSAQRVAERAVHALARASGGAAGLLAVIGPHIGPCCYEVDDPVRDAVGHGPVFAPSDRDGHYRLDLHALNRDQLLHAGVRPERIDSVDGCTSCDRERFFSHRRDGPTGRLLHWVRRPGASSRTA